MPSLAFCMPAHGRVDLARLCMRQLRLTCDALESEGIRASAVVVADDENLDTAAELGFATVRRDNRFLSRKFNDAFQLALDEAFNPHPFTHACPIGSDDWVDHRIFRVLPSPDRVLGFKQIAFVSEDGRELIPHTLPYPAGSGIRVYPRELLAPVAYRPADEDRHRACDTSILTNLRMEWRDRGREIPIAYNDQHAFQIVDWKSTGQQLNTFEAVSGYRAGDALDPFEALSDIYPAESLHAMAAHYANRLVPA